MCLMNIWDFQNNRVIDNSTNDMNDAHKQMQENAHIQIVAKKAESREWIRITGIATNVTIKN